jgi:hypothetical protein
MRGAADPVDAAVGLVDHLGPVADALSAAHTKLLA